MTGAQALCHTSGAMLRRLLVPILALTALAAAFGLVACGSGSSSSSAGGSKGQDTVVANAADFPPAGGRTLEQLAKDAPPGKYQLAPSVGVLTPGTERIGFALFNSKREPLERKQVALYATSSPRAPVRGPFPATWSTLHVDPRFQSQTSKTDPDSASSVYVAQVPFTATGKQYLYAVIRDGSGFQGTNTATPFRVRATSSPIPAVGQRVPAISTPTVASAGSIKKIDTRVPPDDMHDIDLKDALKNGKPTVLLFATPALCQSRVCGPVVDITEEIKSEVGNKVNFIHMEIYNDNDLNKGFRPQVHAFGLRSEPWAFVIGADGKVAARFEGAFTPQELKRAVDRAVAS